MQSNQYELSKNKNAGVSLFANRRQRDFYDENGDNFNEYIDSYKHELLVANIKESGIEERVITHLSKKTKRELSLLMVKMKIL